jgi:hypothetical protein
MDILLELLKGKRENDEGEKFNMAKKLDKLVSNW